MPPSVKRLTTRAKNANTHPGQIVLDAQPKRRMKAVKEADDRRLQAAQELKEAEAVVELTQLAELQVDMEEAQAQALANKPKAVKPRPHPVSKKGQGNMRKEGGPDQNGGETDAINNKAAALEDMDMDEDFEPSDDEGLDSMPKKKGRKNAPNQSLKTAITNAHKAAILLEAQDTDIDQGAHAQNSIKKGNSLLA
ncbi:hypothetical protein F4604DRAFT_1915743 [Suillus subluteus]|nr:hypothetical protein F4604DRAFT_1915743 [Suillus subluteus]